jgi:hypothetical protein
MEPIEGSETSAYIYQTPGNYPKENLLYSEHGESLKPRPIRSLYEISCEFVSMPKRRRVVGGYTQERSDVQPNILTLKAV